MPYPKSPAAAFWLPRLLAAAEAVLELHRDDVNDDYPQERPCCHECGDWVPCATVQVITRELLRRDAS